MLIWVRDPEKSVVKSPYAQQFFRPQCPSNRNTDILRYHHFTNILHSTKSGNHPKLHHMDFIYKTYYLQIEKVVLLALYPF